MKRFFKISVFLVFSTVFGYNAELEKAVIDSDVSQVKQILSQHSLKQSDIQKLSTLAQFVFDKRNIEISIAMLPEFFLAYFGGIFSFIGSVAGYFSIYNLSYLKTDKQYIFNRCLLVSVVASGLGASFLYGCYKIFKSTKKWHNDAVDIKQQITAYH